MRLTAPANQMYRALAPLLKLAASQPPDHPFGHLLLDPAGYLRASNGLTFLTARLPEWADRTGDPVLLPARDVQQVLKQMGAVDAVVDTDAGRGRASIVSGGSSFRLPRRDSHDFPDFPGPTDEPQHDGGQLRRLLQIVAFATGGPDRRFQFEGVAVRIGAAGIECAATNGRHLAVATVGDVATTDPVLLVPAKAVDWLGVVDDEQATRGFDDAYVYVTAPTWELASRLLVGRFPDIGQHRQPGPERLDVDLAEMRNALVHSTILGAAGPRAFRLTVNQLTIEHYEGVNLGTSVTLPVTWSGSDMTIGMAASNLLAGLAALTDTRVSLRLGREVDPLSVQASIGDVHYHYLMAPMSLRKA